MATFLYRLGRSAFRARWLVVVLWAVVLGALGIAAAVAPAAEEDTGSFMPGIEAQKAYDLINERFPGADAEGASAQIVFVAQDGQKVTAASVRAVIDEFVDEAGRGDQVAAVASPFKADSVSGDESTAYATVSYKVARTDLTEASKDALQGAVDAARGQGVTVEVGGNALATQPAAGGTAEVVGICIAAVVLLVTLGSLAAAGLPLLTALIGVGISMAAIMAVGSFLGLSTTTGTLAIMLGLAVGIDYALFVVTRYREERAGGHVPREAVGRAVGTAGSAVVFAGLTVIIALAGLAVVQVPMLTKMGLSAAAAVAVGVIIALTLVPALLGMWPNAVLSRAVRKGGAGRGRANDEGNGGQRWARFVLRRPITVLVTAVLGLGALALPVTSLELGMPGAESQSTATTERRAYDALAEGFGPGFNGPLTVVVDARGASDAQSAAAGIAKMMKDSPGVLNVTPVRFNSSGDTALFSAVPSTSPTDEATKDLVQEIRDERAAMEAKTGATFEVTGSTAMNIDTATGMQSKLVPYLTVVVGLALILLLVVFRSVLVPVKAAFGFLLSVLASLGVVVAVFQWGWGADLLGIEETGPIISLMPIFLVGIVFGLAMDYEVFLVARMREAYVHGEHPRQAVVAGFKHNARVVVAAAGIMMAVFSGFVGSDQAIIKTMGFGLAVAVLFDAFVVRMAIVPAVLTLLGDKAWWLPHRLDRLLPHLDVEGAALDTPPKERAPDDAGHKETASV
ncbi:MMPL family transporter [Streptomyces sp. NPDC047315]|uniref:MMPL family transporter n=1 Tax=Streptomyces sp. NPDC047315 TaxID=3155142 RepID=UPI00340F7275